MGAFAAAADTLFADPNGSAAGVFLPEAGGEVAVRVLVTRPDSEVAIGRAGARAPGVRIDVRGLLSVRPKPGKDRIRVDGVIHIITDVEQEPGGGWYTLDCTPT